MVSLAKHRNTIRELKEKRAKELMSHKFCGEELQKELKELKKFKSMQVEKDQLYTLSQELLGTRVLSSSYPVLLFKQFIWFKLRAVKEGRSYEITTLQNSWKHFWEVILRTRISCVRFVCMRWLFLWTAIQILFLSQAMFS